MRHFVLGLALLMSIPLLASDELPHELLVKVYRLSDLERFYRERATEHFEFARRLAERMRLRSYHGHTGVIVEWMDRDEIRFYEGRGWNDVRTADRVRFEAAALIQNYRESRRFPTPR